MAWANISLWSEEKTVTFYLGKSRTGFSYQLSYSDYSKLCEPLLGYRPQFESVEDLVALALAEWKQVVEE